MINRILTATICRALKIPAVNSMIQDHNSDLLRDMTHIAEETADKAVADFRPEIDADNVEGLSRFVEDTISECISNDGIEADSIKGLDREIEDAVTAAIDDSLDIEALTNSIFSNKDALEFVVDAIESEQEKRQEKARVSYRVSDLDEAFGPLVL